MTSSTLVSATFALGARPVRAAVLHTEGYWFESSLGYYQGMVKPGITPALGVGVPGSNPGALTFGPVVTTGTRGICTAKIRVRIPVGPPCSKSDYR